MISMTHYAFMLSAAVLSGSPCITLANSGVLPQTVHVSVQRLPSDAAAPPDLRHKHLP